MVWNLTPGQVARCGAVAIFNVVGTLRHPERVREFSYSLNGGPDTPIYVKRGNETDRLSAPGDFNIDTISLSSLHEQNQLRFRVEREDRRTALIEIPFKARPFQTTSPDFTLDLSDTCAAEEAGQVVDGHWGVARDEKDRKCLEIAPERAGYDRIILFGRHDWTSGYEILARISVTAITGPHNVGLLFKWNPHEQGDGTWLPTQWSTGLGYYCSYGPDPGVRIRFGVDVHHNEAGAKVGDHLLGRAHLSQARFAWAQFKRRFHPSSRESELVLNRDYFCRLKVHPDQYALTMWQASHDPTSWVGARMREPPPQVVIDNPVEMLPRGSVGIIVHHAGIRVYEFKVKPIERLPAKTERSG
jgi:hypothetical protein